MTTALVFAVGVWPEFGNFISEARPWLSTGALVGLLALCVKLFLDNKKMELDTDGGIRDHYAKEVASLRQQITEREANADARLANAEKRYSLMVEEAERRHDRCEKECDRLREKVFGLERQIMQFHKTSLKFFELRDDLPEETKEFLRSLEQPGYLYEGLKDDGNHS